MKLMLVMLVSPSTSRKVVSTETIATTSGSTARKLANRKASTTRAPTLPMTVSASTPTPPALLPAASWPNPVASAVIPGGAAARTAARIAGA